MVDKTSLIIPAIGQQDSLSITSNVPWGVSIPPSNSWILIDKTSDTAGISTVHFVFTENTSTEPKTATLLINSLGAPMTPVSVIVNQEQQDVVINYFDSPAPGGDTITIRGNGFSGLSAENIVKINGVSATVINATPTTLSIVVPSKVGSGLVEVTVNTKADTSLYDFQYEWTGVVTLFAGSSRGNENGQGTAAQFRQPSGLDIDAAGNVYVADYGNYAIRKISPQGKVTTFPGRAPLAPTQAPLVYNLPNDIAVDAYRKYLCGRIQWECYN